MLAIDDASPEILKACRGEGPYSRDVRAVVAAVLRRHDLMHAHYKDADGSLYACIEHDVHEDVARALEALFPIPKSTVQWGVRFDWAPDDVEIAVSQSAAQWRVNNTFPGETKVVSRRVEEWVEAR